MNLFVDYYFFLLKSSKLGGGGLSFTFLYLYGFKGLLLKENAAKIEKVVIHATVTVSVLASFP
jgi:hypothetical protein